MNIKNILLKPFTGEKAKQVKGWEIGLLVLFFAAGMAIGLVFG